MKEHAHSQTIKVLHATAPTCFWSWGYEAVLNRLKLVYGDQIETKLVTLCVYDNFDEWLKNYEMTFQETVEWAKECSELMQIPLETNLKRENFPKSVLPATFAVFAAQKQGHDKAERLQRAILRRFNIELQDVSKEAVLVEAANEAGLDIAKFKKDFADKKAREKDAEHQGEGMPHIPLSFYNIVVMAADGKRYVNLEHAFDPKVVEGAIDYLSDGKLKKKEPADIAAYLRQHGLAPLMEISRVFNLTPETAKEKLSALEKQNKIQKKILAGAPHWYA